MAARTAGSRLPALPSSQLYSHRSLSSQHQGRVIKDSVVASVLVFVLACNKVVSSLYRGNVYLIHGFTVYVQSATL